MYGNLPAKLSGLGCSYVGMCIMLASRGSALIAVNRAGIFQYTWMAGESPPSSQCRRGGTTWTTMLSRARAHMDGRVLDEWAVLKSYRGWIIRGAQVMKTARLLAADTVLGVHVKYGRHG